MSRLSPGSPGNCSSLATETEWCAVIGYSSRKKVPARDCRCVRKKNVIYFMPHAKGGACSIKIVGYWPCYIFTCLCTLIVSLAVEIRMQSVNSASGIKNILHNLGRYLVLLTEQVCAH